jgi:hypothetical protein
MIFIPIDLKNNHVMNLQLQAAVLPVLCYIVRGLVRVPNFEVDAFVRRMLRDIFVIYLPRFPTRNVTTWHPLTVAMVGNFVSPPARRRHLIDIFATVVKERDYKFNNSKIYSQFFLFFFKIHDEKLCIMETLQGFLFVA